MKGDFSRNTFDRTKHYNTVLMQQGRVQVDADWNEQQAIHQHRIETEAIDVIGKCGAPKHGGGFTIAAAGDQFTISAGRFYVDGILCENEIEDLQYSEQPDLPLIPELDLNTLFSQAAEGRCIIYLDVWKRHLNALDDPAIREVALGGPDTTTRLKTIWQVKVLPITDPVDELSCDSELPNWDDLIAPSTGMLNAQTSEATETDSPCLIPPDAGYQRLENQLYRVEIHQGSDAEAVTFKWSRDNGSVVTEIKRINNAQVTVADLGPDEVLGFVAGQWVELVDDALDLNGLPGELHEIQSLGTDDEGRPAINLVTAPNPLAPVEDVSDGVNPDRHPKLRRWDGASENGLAILEDWIPLEAGIQVRFSTGTYKTGEYWLIPARTATGQIEWPMTDAPVPMPMPQRPLGITHHYCRLAIAQLLPNTDPDNNENALTILQICDYEFPPLTERDPGESCCTVVVQPGESIQAALDTLPPTGGCVCLKTGIHDIRQPIRIETSNVVLKGESPGTRVVHNDGLSLLTIVGPQNQLITDIVVEQIHFEATGFEEITIDPITPALLDLVLVLMGNCLNVRVQSCRFEVAVQQNATTGSNRPVALTIGGVIINSQHVTLAENIFHLNTIGIWTEGAADCDFLGNQFIGPSIQIEDLSYPLAYAGILLNPLTPETALLGDHCQINNNQFENNLLGIVGGIRNDHCHILNNQILRPAIPQLLIEDFENQYLAGNEPYIYGIITYSNHCIIQDNIIPLDCPSYGGIRVFGTHTRVEHNTLISNLTQSIQRNATQLPLCIFLGRLADNDELFTSVVFNASIVKGNKLIGALTGIGAANTAGIKISENQMEFSDVVMTAFPIGVGLGNTQNTVVRHNCINGAEIGIFLLGNPPVQGIGNRILDNQISDGVYGIGALLETALEVSGNHIDNMTVAGFAANNLIERVVITHNQIDHCGYRPPPPPANSLATMPAVGAGIFIISVLGDLVLQSCQVFNTGISRQGEVTPTGTFWGIAIGLVLSCDITQNHVFYSDSVAFNQISQTPAHRSLLLLGWFVLPVNNDSRYPQLGTAMVNSNIFQGMGLPHLVEFLQDPNFPQIGFEQVTFSQNQCFHLRSQISQPPLDLIPRRSSSTVATWGRDLIVTNNQVKALDNPNFPSIDLSNPERVTLIGNIASGQIFNFGSNVIPDSPGNFNSYF